MGESGFGDEGEWMASTVSGGCSVVEQMGRW